MSESLYPAALALDPGWAADTVAVQAGRPARVSGAPMNAPITLSSTYVHDAIVEYGRDGNAGWAALETALGALDGGRAVTFASGLAASTAIADLVPAGGTVVLSSVTYYGVRNIFERMAGRGRLHVRMTPADDTAAVLAAADGADMVWVESIANPLMVVADVPAIAAGARGRGAITVVDATFATPLRQRPLDLGADIVMHAATKLIAGHSDLLLGAAVCRTDAHADFLAAYRHDHGAIPGALEAFLALRGLRTLAVRLDRAEASAAELARRLASHPHVSKVNYPGLPGDPQHERALRVLPNGSGSMLFVRGRRHRRADGGLPCTSAAADPRDQPRGRGVAHRAPRALRRRRHRRRPHPVPPVGRHRERRGPLGRSRRGAARRAWLRGGTGAVGPIDRPDVSRGRPPVRRCRVPLPAASVIGRRLPRHARRRSGSRRRVQGSARTVDPMSIEWTPPARPCLRRKRRESGAPGRTRTADAGLRTASLYPLSYGGVGIDRTAASQHGDARGLWRQVEPRAPAARPRRRMPRDGPGGPVSPPRSPAVAPRRLPPVRRRAAARRRPSRRALSDRAPRAGHRGAKHHRRPRHRARAASSRSRSWTWAAAGCRWRFARAPSACSWRRRSTAPSLRGFRLGAPAPSRMTAPSHTPGAPADRMAASDLTLAARVRRGDHQLRVAVRAAARARLPRPADRRGRRPRARSPAPAARRAGWRSATPSPTWWASRPCSRSSA